MYVHRCELSHSTTFSRLGVIPVDQGGAALHVISAPLAGAEVPSSAGFASLVPCVGACFQWPEVNSRREQVRECVFELLQM